MIRLEKHSENMSISEGKRNKSGLKKGRIF